MHSKLRIKVLYSHSRFAKCEVTNNFTSAKLKELNTYRKQNINIRSYGKKAVESSTL